MSLIATVALAVSAGAQLPQCSWDRPGVNPFVGDVIEAVDHYQDIPAATRAKLKARMKARSYDDIAVIERNAIRGKANYAPEIRDMHFGPGAVCLTVTRTKWTATTQERGLVYCEDGECILVPTVCRNVSRIQRRPPQASAAPGRKDDGPLEFDPPGAGPLAAPPGAVTDPAGVPTRFGNAAPWSATPSPDHGPALLAPFADPAGNPFGPSTSGLLSDFGRSEGPSANPGGSTTGTDPGGWIPIIAGLPTGPSPGLPTDPTQPIDDPGTTVDVADPGRHDPARLPEPGSLALVGLGLLALLYRGRRSSGAR